MKIAVVTGANGFVGSALVKELVHNGYNVFAVCLPSRDKNIIENPAVKKVYCDISSIADLKDLIKLQQGETIDCFYNLAWIGSSGDDRFDVDLQLNNVIYTINSLRVAKELNCKRFVCVGSTTELEAVRALYFTDKDCKDKRYVYGAAKVACCMFGIQEGERIGVEVVGVILHNAYGIGDYSNRMLNATIKKCVSGEDCNFTSGTQNYDFIYIDDAVRGFRLIGEKGKTAYVYHIGSPSPRPLKEFLIELKNAVNTTSKFNFGGLPYNGIDLTIEELDCSKTERDTGFKAEISFAEGCRRTFDWWRERLKNEH